MDDTICVRVCVCWSSGCNRWGVLQCSFKDRGEGLPHYILTPNWWVGTHPINPLNTHMHTECVVFITVCMCVWHYTGICVWTKRVRSELNCQTVQSVCTRRVCVCEGPSCWDGDSLVSGVGRNMNNRTGSSGFKADLCRVKQVELGTISLTDTRWYKHTHWTVNTPRQHAVW